MTRRPFEDRHRPAWDGSGPRPLVTTIWYPTTDTAQLDTLTMGIPGRPPAFLAGRVATEAPMTPGVRRPLILLSHGTGGSALQLAWLGITLAERGYIVAAVNHHGNTAAEPAYDPRGFLLWWERARDLSAVLDQLLQDSLLGPRIDSTRIGAAGFSLGGYTVLALAGAETDLEGFKTFCAGASHDATCDPQPEMPDAMNQLDRLVASDTAVRRSLAEAGGSIRDLRIRAIAALAPAVVHGLSAASLQQIALPVMLIAGEADRTAPLATNARYASTLIPGASFTALPGVGHYTFLADCTDRGRRALPDLCGEAAGTDRRAVHRRIAAQLTAFFDRALAAAH